MEDIVSPRSLGCENIEELRLSLRGLAIKDPIRLVPPDVPLVRCTISLIHYSGDSSAADSLCMLVSLSPSKTPLLHWGKQLDLLRACTSIRCFMYDLLDSDKVLVRSHPEFMSNSDGG